MAEVDVRIKNLSFVPVFLQRRIQFRESSHEAPSENILTLKRPSELGPAAPLAAMSVGSGAATRGMQFSGGRQKGLFSQERILAHMNWESVLPVGPGLVNLGNTCFLNSVLQCLTYIPPFVNYLLSRDHSHHCTIKSVCVFCEMEKHVLLCLKPPHAASQSSSIHSHAHHYRSAICPKGIVGNMKHIAKHMKFGRQEDAHEFIRFLLDSMQKSTLHGLDKKLDPKLKETTVINQIFGGYLSSRITCLQCEHVSDTFDAFLDICLDIRHAATLSRAFELFVAPERLCRDNSYQCSKCHHLVNAEKRLSIKQAPLVLTIQLKRFAFKGYGSDTKISRPVSFSEELNIGPFMTDPQTSISYRLCGVLVHSGSSCNSGHYYSYVRSASDIWYSMNDSSVHPVGLATVLRQSAYLLIYTLDASSLPSAASSERTEMSPAALSRTTAEACETIQELKIDSSVLVADTRVDSFSLSFSSPSLSQKELRKSTALSAKLPWVEGALSMGPADASPGSLPLPAHPFKTLFGSLAAKPWTEDDLHGLSQLRNGPASRCSQSIDKRSSSYDQEYDQGKAKKVKSKEMEHLHAHPKHFNPFQKLTNLKHERPHHRKESPAGQQAKADKYFQ